MKKKALSPVYLERLDGHNKMSREKLIPMAEVVAAIRRIDRLGSATDKEALSAALKLPFQYFRERQERDGKARSREIIVAIGAKFKRRSPRKP